MQESEVKLCPFCGTKPEVYHDHQDNLYGVRCDKCWNVEQVDTRKKNAIRDWNTRTPDTTKSVEALENMIMEFDPDRPRRDPYNNNRIDAGARLTLGKAKQALESVKGGK